MFATALIVFRETLEAALFVGIVAASCRGLMGRGRWLGAGVLAGALGALLLAAGMGQVAQWADGLGQEMVNLIIVSCALLMLGYHSIWVSTHAKEMVMQARSLGQSALQGGALWALAVAVAMAVLREGAETVLFVAGIASGETNQPTWRLLLGCVSGLLAGVALGVAIYAGMARIKTQSIFSVTQVLMCLLTGSLASQLAKTLVQADVLSWGAQTAWDVSGVLSNSSPVAVLLHALVGYEAQPSVLQVLFYGGTVLIVLAATRWVKSMGVMPTAAQTAAV